MRSAILQLIVFGFIFWGITLWRETSMLEDDTPVSAKSLHFSTLNGESFQVTNQGDKTVLYFFAPWCQVCNMSIDNLEKLHQEKPELQVIAVALDYESTQSVVDFVQRHQLSFPIVLGTSQHKMAFKISGYPSYYVLNNTFKITGKSLGYSTETGLLLRTL
jgi:thiol-disulfide isomerase/thioredoxin